MSTPNTELIKLFNQNPKAATQALKFKTSNEIAEFLYDNRNLLDVDKIGELIGGEKNKNILDSYLEKFDFKDHSLPDAIQSFVSTFKLPGEAQVISRIMEAFAERFYSQNPGYLKADKSDDVFVLTFAVIMLNTNLHNPAVKEKMTREQFLNQLRHLPHLNKNDLTRIYNNVLANPFSLEVAAIKTGIILTTAKFQDLTAGLEILQSDQKTGTLKLDDKQLALKEHSRYNSIFRLVLGAQKTVVVVAGDKPAAEITYYKPSLLASIFGKNESIHVKPLGNNPENLLLTSKIASLLNRDGTCKVTETAGFASRLKRYREATSELAAEAAVPVVAVKPVASILTRAVRALRTFAGYVVNGGKVEAQAADQKTEGAAQSKAVAAVAPAVMLPLRAATAEHDPFEFEKWHGPLPRASTANDSMSDRDTNLMDLDEWQQEPDTHNPDKDLMDLNESEPVSSMVDSDHPSSDGEEMSAADLERQRRAAEKTAEDAALREDDDPATIEHMRKIDAVKRIKIADKDIETPPSSDDSNTKIKLEPPPTVSGRRRP